MGKKPRRGRGVNRSFYKESNAEPGEVKTTMFMETDVSLHAEPPLTFTKNNRKDSAHKVNSLPPVMTPGHDTKEHLARINIQPLKEGELPWE